MKITKSSGNVFLDIGFPPIEAERLLNDSRRKVAIQLLREVFDTLGGKVDAGRDVMKAVSLLEEINLPQLDEEEMRLITEYREKKAERKALADKQAACAHEWLDNSAPWDRDYSYRCPKCGANK